MKGTETQSHSLACPLDLPLKVARKSADIGWQLGFKVLGRGLAIVEYIERRRPSLPARIIAERPEQEVAIGLTTIEQGNNLGDQQLIEIGKHYARNGVALAESNLRAAQTAYTDVFKQVQDAGVDPAEVGLNEFSAEQMSRARHPSSQPAPGRD